MDIVVAVVIAGIAILFGIMAVTPLVADPARSRRSARPIATVVSIDESQQGAARAA